LPTEVKRQAENSAHNQSRSTSRISKTTGQ
jgi:hypothetical protein